MQTVKNFMLLLGVIMTVTSFYSCYDDTANPQSTSRCVDDIIEQLTGDGKLDIDKSDERFGIKAPYLGNLVYDHVQGIGRLRDWNGMGRMVLTENGTGKGIYVAFQPIENADKGLYADADRMSDVVSFDIQSVPAYGDHNHPGGLQAQGDYVAVAMEGGNAQHAAVYFLKVEGRDIEFVTSLDMDGSRGEPYQANQKSAATAGFVKLDSGHFLVAVSGARHGKQGIWFYESTTEFIDETTEWDFINFKAFECEGYGQVQDECYIGAGGGLNLVKDCSGNIYMLAMHGTAPDNLSDIPNVILDFFGIVEKDKEWLQVFRIWKEGDEIALQKVTQQRDKLCSITDKSFRWAGGSHVSKNGTLEIFNTERRRYVDAPLYVNGHVYFRKK